MRSSFFVQILGLYLSLQHRRSHNSTDIFVEITNNTLYESKLYIFLLWQKSLDINIMFHEDITYRKYIKT